MTTGRESDSNTDFQIDVKECALRNKLIQAYYVEEDVGKKSDSEKTFSVESFMVIRITYFIFF